MDYVTVGAVAAGAVALAWPKIASTYSWLTTSEEDPITTSIRLANSKSSTPNPGYHKWDAVELDALKYAVGKLPQDTTIGQFADAVVIGEDYRDTIVSLLSGGHE